MTTRAPFLEPLLTKNDGGDGRSGLYNPSGQLGMRSFKIVTSIFRE